MYVYSQKNSKKYKVTGLNKIYFNRKNNIVFILAVSYVE